MCVPVDGNIQVRCPGAAGGAAKAPRGRRRRTHRYVAQATSDAGHQTSLALGSSWCVASRRPWAPALTPTYGGKRARAALADVAVTGPEPLRPSHAARKASVEGLTRPRPHGRGPRSSAKGGVRAAERPAFVVSTAAVPAVVRSPRSGIQGGTGRGSGPARGDGGSGGTADPDRDPVSKRRC